MSPSSQSAAGVPLPSGVFTISLDFELIWGTIDKPSWNRMRPLCVTEREEIVGRLLDLFHRYHVRASWCTVGHLFLDRCAPWGHPEIDPSASDDRFRRDPCTGEDRDSIFYGRSLVSRIQECPTPQEIGCHSFSHVDFSKCSRERAEAELRASIQAAHGLGIEMTSFVFPRNRVGHLDLLPRFGFQLFRGPDRTWHESAPQRQWRHRAGHLADVLRAAEPPTVLPEWNEHGLWDIPGSMLYTPSHGFRQYIPVERRVRRAFKGLHAAARDNRIFHLWFHPTDLAVRSQAMLAGLERILQEATALREKGQLAVLPLCEIPGYAMVGADRSLPVGAAMGRDR